MSRKKGIVESPILIPWNSTELKLMRFLEPEFNMIQAMIDARKGCNMTQKELADRTGIDQSDISKIETGNANPSLATLKRLAEGMDMILKLEFIPKSVK